MAWQDIAITVCVLAFSYALIPQVILGYKTKKPLVAKQTALINSIGMAILAITYITLNLKFSPIMSFTGSVLWAIIFIQTIIYKKQ